MLPDEGPPEGGPYEGRRPLRMRGWV